jgi:hypothetical protein
MPLAPRLPADKSFPAGKSGGNGGRPPEKLMGVVMGHSYARIFSAWLYIPLVMSMVATLAS